MPAPAIIHELVRKFEENYDLYHASNYNEAQLRLEFLDPFFEALGWDIKNTRGLAPNYREVVVEDSIKVEGSSKAPDYAFRVGAERKFFVEAKKPAVDVSTEKKHAFQVRRYAWNAHLSLSILTDFEEMAVYNTNNRPLPGDSVATAREKLYQYTDYVEKWDEIAAIFSRDAVWKGAFDRFAERTRGKKGTTRVDDAFLADIEEWRLNLARNIALRNEFIQDEYQLNYAVQMTIDRIIFLRICEDREIEGEEQLLRLTEHLDIYQHLLEIYHRADIKYNSGLFHFQEEPGNDSPVDTFTPRLTIDDRVLKEIIKSIYYPCPYIFKEIPVEILGQVYEQFLGSVIRLTAGRRAKVEQKPEVRKAGGVYYTPRYIVDYIVENTVGKLLEGKNPTQAESLTIVDPACGSGSFLLGAYQYLLDWHLAWYTENDPDRWMKGKDPALMPSADGSYKLTSEKKKAILVNNIYGVDIDAQAVEVTKLSLLLKVLEGESGQLSLGLERVLPDLSRNIQCGNSLIGNDYFEGQLLPDPEERRRVNPFEWRFAFPQVFARGGFDVVIGNPPYVRQESLGNDKAYFQKHYEVYAGTADLYAYFIEKGVSLLSHGGQFSYIVANKWMRANYGKPLRKWMKEKCIEEIIDFGDLPVFEGATTYPCIIRIQNNEPHYQPKITNVENLDFTNLRDHVINNSYLLNQTSFDNNGWSLASPEVQKLISKITSNFIPLENFVNSQIFYGLKTGLNEAFVVDEETKNRIIKTEPHSANLIKPFLNGRDIKRYETPQKNKYIILIQKGWTRLSSKNAANAWKWFQLNYPVLSEHLAPFAQAAMKRYDQGDYWWELRACDYYDEFEKSKIIFPDISLSGNFMCDDEGGFYSVNTTYIIPDNNRYLLGLLNSKLFTFIYSEISSSYRGGYLRYIYQYVAQLPICTIDFTNPADVAMHDRMVALVERMLALHKQTPLTPQEEAMRQREIAATDRQIDALVYELYGLTEEEIKIVEGN